MLKLILGGSGSGKTFTVLQQIGELAAKEPDCAPILLVPEQFSYETERLLLQRLGPQAAANVKVYGFTRFSELVLRDCGVIPKKPLDEATRLLLIDQALSGAQERLSSRMQYREGNVGQLQLLMGAMKELKQNAVTHDVLQEARNKLSDDSVILKEKLADLDVLQEAFSALITARFDDPQDLLTQAKDCLTEHPGLYAGVHVFLDGFTGFTVQEEQLLSCLMRRAACVTAALCANGYADSETEEYDLFSLPKKTARRLTFLAGEAGVPVAPFTVLTEDYRHQNESLKALCDGMFLTDGAEFNAEDDVEKKAFTVFSCADKDEECRAVAREIRFFLRNGIFEKEGEGAGGRCRDVAIVTRSPESYRGALEMALQSEGIPYYVDAKESIRGDALTETVCAALQVVRFSFQTEDILRLLKTGLVGLSVEETARLENYAYLWQLRGSAWKEPFTADPNGLKAPEDEKGKERSAKELAYLNELRERAIAPLLRLKAALTGNVTGETFAKAVFTYLLDVGADEQTRQRIRRLDEAGQPALADRTERVWTVMTELLDVFAKGGVQNRSLAVWADLFAAAATATELGTVPQGIDAVQVGGVDRSRLSEPRMVILMGVNEGEFPAIPGSGGLLTERERKKLQTVCGLTLSKSKEYVLTEEWLYAYNAVAAAREKVLVTYSRGNLKGEQMFPSSLIGEADRLLPNHAEAEFCTSADWMPETPEEALSYFTATYRNPTPLTAAVKAQLEAIPEQKARVEALLHRADKTPWKLEDSTAVNGLLGKEEITLSATRINKYYNCPFAYFCQYGLRVHSRDRADFGGRESGSFVHAVMETLVPQYVRDYGADNYATLTEEQIRKDVHEASERYVAATVTGIDEATNQMAYEMQTSERKAFEVLRHLIEEFRQSRFVPTDFELKIGEGGAIPPLEIPLKDGTTVKLEGYIDRVDVFTQGEETYIRVVDYKTKKDQEFDLKNIANGVDLQMLLYLYAVCEEGMARYKNPKPAGVLYIPSALPIVEAEDEASRLQAQRETMRMDGALIDQLDVLEAMEYPFNKLYIPVKAKKPNKDGSFSAFTAQSKVMSPSQYNALETLVKRKLTDMVEHLQAGEIPAVPMDSSARGTCRYCDYNVVCGREESDPERENHYLDAFEGSGFKSLIEFIEKQETSAKTE